MRKLEAAVGVLVLALVATGCIRFEGNITVADDGTGTVDVISALDPGALGSAFEDFGLPEEETGSPEDLCAEFGSETDPASLPEGAQVNPYTEDGFCPARACSTHSLPPPTTRLP